MTAPPWTPNDPLGDALHALRLRGAFYCRTHVTAPWALEMPALDDCLSFHVLTEGACWLEVPGREPLELRSGDFALVPHGRGHVLASEPGLRPAGRVDHLPQRYVGDHYSVLTYGGGGTPANLVCGVVTFDAPAARSLIAALPAVLHVAADHRPIPTWIGETVRLMAAELHEQRPGGEAVITRLADILVVQAVRSWLEQDPDARRGWLGALRDERIGPSLAAIHREPGRPWTVAALAREAGMSRSAFAERFAELVGEPVMAYVTRWRMQVAHERLAGGTDTVARVAASLGYRSEAAFTRAFARVTGTTPGAVRRASTRDTGELT
jgi:AraC-like DNA-binding protein